MANKYVRINVSAKLGELRMTQKDLARKTGIRAATINEIRNEVCASLKLEHIALICNTLNCDIGDILRLETRKSIFKKAKSMI